MGINASFNILWRSTQRHTYQHGSIIRFCSNGTYFENQLMPSGLQIHLWCMTTRFDNDGSTPSLPILKKGYRYRLMCDVETYPANSVYFIITFYRKNDTELQQLMVKEKCKYFEYPKEAYRYEIRMINAACQRLMFRRIVLTEVHSATVTEVSTTHFDNKVKQVHQIIQRTRV
ncbi:TPA: accessory Sec system protein Asp3 [Staphylococcus delphini]|nr:accessory Sec system protein Asp3 [Staphylococcus delphini]